MFSSLNKLKKLLLENKNLLWYEYTKNNLEFCMTMTPTINFLKSKAKEIDREVKKNYQPFQATSRMSLAVIFS